jgi:hypothetical protein
LIARTRELLLLLLEDNNINRLAITTEVIMYVVKIKIKIKKDCFTYVRVKC